MTLPMSRSALTCWAMSQPFPVGTARLTAMKAAKDAVASANTNVESRRPCSSVRPRTLTVLNTANSAPTNVLAQGEALSTAYTSWYRCPGVVSPCTENSVPSAMKLSARYMILVSRTERTASISTAQMTAAMREAPDTTQKWKGGAAHRAASD